jgi:hypothetical protein
MEVCYMSQLTRSSPHVLSGALIFSAALAVSACSDGGRSPAAPTAMLGTTSNSSAPEGTGTITEQAAYNGTICSLVFPGTPSQTSETFAIWNFGHAILDVPFDTPRPDLYGILPGTMHEVPGYPAFDHDHIVSHAPGDRGYNGTWDVWVVAPGQHFNPATYQAPRSIAAMFTLISSGVLAEPVGMAAAGFGRDLVIRAPLVCR